MSLAALLVLASGLTINHEPVACVVKDRFPLIEVTVEPALDVAKARVYFKSAQAIDYHSVDMTLSLGRFTGKLPKPKEKAGSVVYYIEVVAADGTVRKTPEMSAQVVKQRNACPEGGIVAAEGSQSNVRVSATATIATRPEGFSGIAGVIPKFAAATPESSSEAAATDQPARASATEPPLSPPAGLNEPTPSPLPLPTGPTSRAPTSGGDSDYQIGAGDILRVTVYGHDDLSQTVVVQGDGTFVFPLVGRVKASDMTTRELERKLTILLAQGYIRNPQITVLVQEYRSKMVFVVGELAKPGTYSLADSKTVVELLARAGPLTANAGSELLIVRPLTEVQGPTLPTEVAEPGSEAAATAKKLAEVIRLDVRDLTAGNLERNVELRPNDTIFVPQAARYFVSGEVRNPGSFTLTPGLTISQAIIVAGGYTERAASGKFRVMRSVDGKPKEFKVKPNDPVQPGDTVVVKEKLF